VTDPSSNDRPWAEPDSDRSPSRPAAPPPPPPPAPEPTPPPPPPPEGPEPWSWLPPKPGGAAAEAELPQVATRPDPAAWSTEAPPPPPGGWGSVPPTRPNRPTIWGPDSGPTPPLPGMPQGAPPGRRFGGRQPLPGTPQWAPPGQRGPSALRQLLPATILCLVVVAAAVGTVLYAKAQDDDKYPDHWDPRVADLVKYVEKERGLKFDHPVEVEFLTPGEYSDAVRFDEGDLTEDETDQLDHQASFLRALGLAHGDLDLAAATNDLQDTGTLAQYNLYTKHVMVRGTEVDLDLRPTLIHELTHALQDQHFDLLQLQVDLDLDPDDPDQDALGGYQALVEGDAVRIERAYVQQLPKDQFDQYVDHYNAEVDASNEKLDDVPSALRASMVVPYVLGQPLVELIAADGGNKAVDKAFDDLPSTSEHMLDPRSYFGDTEVGEVDDPSLGVSDPIEQGTFSAVDLYLLLAERLDPLQALHAADGWQAGRFVQFEQDGQTCVRFRVDEDSDQDLDELSKGLGDWIAAAPEEMDATTYTTYGATSCDPGTDGPDITDRSWDTLQLPAVRSQLMVEAVQFGNLELGEAWDASNCVVDRLGYDKTLAVANAVEEGDIPAELDPAISLCFGDSDSDSA